MHIEMTTHEDADLSELRRLCEAMRAANRPSDRSVVANRLFQHAHRLWRMGSLALPVYRRILANIDEGRGN